MIQVFYNSFKVFQKNKNRKIISLLLSCFIFFIILLNKYHLDNDASLNVLLNNIFQFSGIFSALLITFIISKIFQIRQEKLRRHEEIIILSNKVTDFRRICRVLYDERDIWSENMIYKMNNKYKNLTYFQIHLDIAKEPCVMKLIKEYHTESDNFGAEFYLALKSLVIIPQKPFQTELYDDYDYNFLYSFELVSQWYGANSANSFYYYLDNKWHSYKTAFNFSALSEINKNQIISLAKKINPKKYESSIFDKDTLVSIGNDFEAYIFRRLYILCYYNEQGIPDTLIFLIRILVITMLFGVFIPLWLSSVIITNLNVKLTVSNISIIILSLSIIYFIFTFKNILENEIRISSEDI